MFQSSLLTPRFRTVAAIVLLVASGICLVVALSQLFVGVGADPRDSLGSRAAGLGFGDRAHDTLYGVVPLALPVVAALLSPHQGVRLTAVIGYVLLIATGVLISVSAFTFGLDLADTQSDSGIVPPWIDTRSAVRFLAVDIAWLAGAVVGLMVAVRAWRRSED